MAAQSVSWTVQFEAIHSALKDRGRVTLGALTGASDGFDALDELHPPELTAHYMDVVTAHVQTEPGWEMQPELFDSYRKDVVAPFGQNPRSFRFTVSTDTPGNVNLTFGGYDELSPLAAYNARLVDETTGASRDMWTTFSYQFSVTSVPHVRQFRVDLTPGRATQPIAYNVNVTTTEEQPVVVTLRGSDFDSCDLSFTATPPFGPTGTISPVEPRPCLPGEPNVDTASVVFAPARDRTGGVLFSYKVTDERGVSSGQATVTVTIMNVNDAPFAPDTSVTLPEDTSKPITLAVVDPDTSFHTYAIVTPPTHGTLAVSPHNSQLLTYIPSRNYVGPDSFTWKAAEVPAGFESNVGTVTITVQPIDGPVAVLSVTPRVGVGDTATADGSGSFHRFPPKQVVSYTFAFGDGTPSYTETAASAPDGAFDGRTTHVYTATGTYTVTLTTKDDATPQISDVATATVNVPGRDLVVRAIDLSAFDVDGQTLGVSGLLRATVESLSAIETTRPFDVAFFEDRDLDGQYTPGSDALLGTASSQAPVTPGERRVVAAAATGSLLFAGNRIFALVDSGQAIAETHEENNVRHSASTCIDRPAAPPLAPVVQWERNTFAVQPGYKGADFIANVGDLDLDGYPEVAFVAMKGSTFFEEGYLRVLHGQSGSDYWVSQQQMRSATVVALGNIDADPNPEVIGKTRVLELIALEHDGTFKWKTTPNAVPSLGYEIALADLDGDGLSEILVGNQAYNANGTLRWSFAETFAASSNVTVADLDLDGRPEVLVGRMARRADGSLFWKASVGLGGGTSVAAQLDPDPWPEIVLADSASGSVYVLEHDGSVKWGPVVFPPNFTSRTVGPPTVGDVDGDGVPEIGISSYRELRIMRSTDGSTLWSAVIDDTSSGVDIAQFFDLEGDGQVEVLHVDQQYFRIYRGTDGTVLYQIRRPSHTGYDEPVVADVDGDGEVEIVIGKNCEGCSPPTDNGVMVLGSGNGSWVDGPSVWNQLTYHVTNVEQGSGPAFTIPALERNSFHAHNSYFCQLGYERESVDLVPSYVRVSEAGGTRTIIVRVGNGGRRTAPSGVAVSFFDGDPNAGGVFLGIATTAGTIAAGAYEDVTMTMPAAGPVGVWVWADRDGAGAMAVTECDEANNIYDSTRTAPGNAAPTASDDAYAGLEDQDIVVAAPGLLANDSDPDGDALAPIIVTPPARGTLVVAGDGSLRYVPAANANGTETFTYQVTDGQQSSNVATVTLTIAAVNDPPVAASHDLLVLEDTATPLTLVATDADGEPLSYTVVSQPTLGTLSGTAPNLTYTPAPNAYGYDLLTFQAFDGQAPSNVAQVRITIREVNDAPTAGNVSASTARGTPVTFALPATDVDGDPLVYSLVTAPTHGSAAVATGSATYIPDTGYVGPDAFTYKANDGAVDSNVATASITVSFANMPPIGRDRVVTTNEDTPLAIVLQGSDPDGDSITFRILTAPAHGVLSGTAPSVTYTPAANFTGTDSFTFVVNDGMVDSNPATIGVNVLPLNDAPVADAGSATTAEDVAAPLQLTGSDVDGDAITFRIVTGPTSGTVSGTPPQVIYFPNPNFHGTDSFTFVTNDGRVDSALATFTITVTPVNDRPIANGQSVTTLEDTARPITLTGSDVDGDPLTFVVATPPTKGALTGSAPDLTYTPYPNANGSDSFRFEVLDGQAESVLATVSIFITPVNDRPVADDLAAAVQQGQSVGLTLTGSDVDGDAITFRVTSSPTQGTLSGTEPNLTYTAGAAASGTDSFTFVVNDGTVDSDPATVTITISGNRPPVASDQTVTTDEDVFVAITLQATDPDGQTLSFAIVSGPSEGTLSGTPPNVTYDPRSNFNGTDSFTFRASDGTSDSNVATVSIIVRPVNDPPEAVASPVTTAEDVSVAITLQATDVDSVDLTFQVTTPPQHGQLSGTAPDLTYVPDRDFNGTDSLTFTVSDGVASDEGTVVITVTPMNDVPEVGDMAEETEEDTSIIFLFEGRDRDEDDLTFEILSGPSHGTATGPLPFVEYEPFLNYNGPDEITYRAFDGQAYSNVGTVRITVTPVNDAPEATPQTVTTPSGTSVTITLMGTDVDGDDLTFRIEAAPGQGTLSGTPPVVTYAPAPGYEGPDSFTFVANDGFLDSLPAAVSITVTGVENNPPDCSQAMVFPGLLWPPNHKMAPIQVLGVTDADGDAITIQIVSIRQDEPVNGLGDGDKSPDATLSPPKVRSERSGTGNGRVYQVTFTASDGKESCTRTITTCAPHDQGPPPDCIDDGPAYDSTQP